MNAPLRRVAISVLVLFTLLILNVNYIQVVRADELRTDPGNTRVLAEEYSRAARLDRRRPATTIAKSVRTNDQLAYLRQYPQGGLYAPVTGYYSLVYGNPGMERAENDVLSGSDPRLFVRRLGRPVHRPGPLRRRRRPDPGPGGAAGRDGPASRASPARSSRSTPPPARSWPWPARRPTTRTSSPATTRPRSAPTRASSPARSPTRRLNQAIERALLARLGVQGRRLRRRAVDRQLHAADDGPGTGPAEPARQHATSWRTTTARAATAAPTSRCIDALTISCNTAFAQLGMTLGEDKVRSMAEAFGIDDSGFDMPLHGGAQHDRCHRRRRAARAVSSIGQQDVQLTPMQGAMIAAAVANQGTLMKPYLVDSVQAPDLTVVDRTEPEELSRPVSAEVAGAAHRR